MLGALEKSCGVKPIPQTLNILADAYERAGQQELSLDLREKAARMILPPARPKSGPTS